MYDEGTMLDFKRHVEIYKMQYNNNVKFYTRSVFLTTSKLTLNFVLRLLVSDPGKNMTTRTLAKNSKKV